MKKCETFPICSIVLKKYRTPIFFKKERVKKKTTEKRMKTILKIK